jgi:hypothetical protein
MELKNLGVLKPMTLASSYAEQEQFEAGELVGFLAIMRLWQSFLTIRLMS